MASYEIYLEDLESLMAQISESEPLPDEFDTITVEIEELLEQLQLESHSIPNKTKKSEVIQRCKTYRKQLDAAKQRNLLGDRPSDEPLNDDERHEVNMHRLRTARNQLVETEEVAIDTIERLGRQEEQLKHVVATNKQVNEELSTSNKLLTRMSKWWRG